MKAIVNYFLVLLIANLIFTFKDGECLSSIEAVRRFFRYFRMDDPMGLPVLEPPEPMPLPPHLELVPVSLYDGKLFGHSRTRINQVEFDFADLTGSFKCSVPHLVLTGGYSWPGIFSTSRGQINTSLTEIEITANFSMKINSEDALQIVDFHNEMIMDDLDLNMTDLLWVHQLILDSGSVNIFFFEIADEITRQVKPIVIDAANDYLAKILNSIPPAVDSVWETSSQIAPEKGSTKSSHAAFFLRRILQYFGADPLRIPDMKISELGMDFKFSEIQLVGLSFIGRIESLLVVYQEGKIFIITSMIYPHLLVKTKLQFKALFFKTRKYITLDMEDAKIRAHMVIDPSQKEPPEITYFDFRIGGFKNLKKARDTGSFKRFVAKSAKTVFNFFLGEVKGSIQKVIQRKLDKVHLEEAAVHFLQH